MMKKFIKLTMCIFLILGFSSFSYSKIIIVPIDYQTLGIPENLNPGDIVFVLPGTYYHPMLSFNWSYPHPPLKLIGTHAENTIIDGNGYPHGFGLPNNMIISGFTITNTGWLELSQDFAFNITISGNIFADTSDRGIFLVGASKIQILNNIFKNQIFGSGFGIDVIMSSDVEIKNNLAYNNLHAMEIGDSSNCSVVYNTFCFSQQTCVGIPASNNLNIAHNIVTHAGPGACGFIVFDSDVIFLNNDVWNPQDYNSTPFCGDIVEPPTNNFSLDPEFIDPENEDFRLKESSPCKTAGPDGGEIGAYGNGGTPGVGIKLPLLQQMEIIFKVMNYLPEENFKKPQYKRVMINHFEIIERNLQRAESPKGSRGSYQSSLNIVKNTILHKTDGCKTSGNPDENDWITDCKAQEWIYSLLLNLIETLEKKLQ